MNDEGRNGRDDADPDGPPTGGRARRFRLELDLGLLSDLVGSVLGATVGDPPPMDHAADRRDVDGYVVRRRVEGEPRPGRNGRGRGSTAERCRIDTRLGDEFVVVADLQGTNEDDLSVGVDPGKNDLVIGRDGTVVGRVEVPWESPEATRVRFNNGVLEVRFRPEEA